MPGIEGGRSCPAPAPADGRVTLAHGGGGRAMASLIESVFLDAFGGPLLSTRHDGAVVHLDGRTAMTTDGSVVRPLFFPGGDIGTLAVNGTVNDLAMCGARPLYLTIGFVLEEGLALDDLARIVASVARAARAAGVENAARDTKLVERGHADGLYLTTTGIGRVEAPDAIGPAGLSPGDTILLSGDLGRHGIAVMDARDSLGLEGLPESDCAPVAAPVLALLESGVTVHCLRDPTRGGLASALVEIAEAAGAILSVEEAAIPVAEPVAAACELLGLDPLHVACEGRFVAFVPEAEAEAALSVLRRDPLCREAAVIGRVAERRGPGAAGRVEMTGTLGGRRVIDRLSGELLPRIC